MINGKLNTIVKAFLGILLLILLSSCEENAFYEKNFLAAAQTDDEINSGAFEDINEDVIDEVIEDVNSDVNEAVNGNITEEEVEEVVDEETNEEIAEEESSEEINETPEQPSVPSIVVKEESFLQKSSENKKIDILWVVDNSGSMQDEQNSLAFNFESFINDFIQKDVDFKMAVTTTDTSWGHKGELIGNLTDLTSVAAASDINGFLNNFKETIKVGINGSGYEKGLLASKSFINNKNSWLREDAMLAIVYLSDEEDQSSGSVSDYVTHLKTLKSNEGMIKLYSIINTGESSLPYYETIGSRYMEASKETGGFHSNIKNDFHETLQAMGTKIVTLLDSFPLSKTPKSEESIQVYIDGNESNGWTYDEASKSIKFNENAVPADGSAIKIKYEI